MDAKYLIITLVAIPLVLILSVSVFESLSLNSRSGFETAVVNESLSASPADTAYDCKDGSVTWVGNATKVGVASTNFNVSYASFDSCTITYSGMAGTVYASYTSYQGIESDASYSDYKSIHSSTNSATKLGSMLPYVLIAVTIITVILGAFGLSRIM